MKKRQAISLLLVSAILGGVIGVTGLFNFQAAGLVLAGTAATALSARQPWRSRAFWRVVINASLAWGALGAVVGIIMMLRNMNDPNTIGPGMSWGLLSIAYGCMIAIVAAVLQNSLCDEKEEAPRPFELWPLCIVGGVLLIVMSFYIVAHSWGPSALPRVPEDLQFQRPIHLPPPEFIPPDSDEE